MRTHYTHADPVVPMHHPRALVELAEQKGVPRAVLLENTGISEAMLLDADVRISHLQFAALVNNALTATSDPGLGLEFGSCLHPGNLGMLGLAVMTSHTLRAALDVALRYTKSLAPAWDLTMDIRDGLAVLTAVPTIKLGPLEVFATESLLAAYEAQGRFFLRRPLPVRTVEVTYSRPAHFERYKERYSAEFRFDAAVTRAMFDATILDERLPWADPVTAHLAERQCAATIDVSDPGDGLMQRVRGFLSAKPGCYPPASEVARALRTSPRSLRRGLQRMSTSYQELLDETRHDDARRLLETTRLSMEEVARKLGFADVRSFRRAFKRWTGVSPGSYRELRARDRNASA